MITEHFPGPTPRTPTIAMFFAMLDAHMAAAEASEAVLLRATDLNLPAVRRCSFGPPISETLRQHVVERRRDAKFIFRGKPSRRWVELDEFIMVGELCGFLAEAEITSFLRSTLGTYVCCVAAQLLEASEKAKLQGIHSDTTSGYGKLVWLVFDIDGGTVDTLLEEGGSLRKMFGSG